MLCRERTAKTSNYPVCYRLAFARQHYLDTTTQAREALDQRGALPRPCGNPSRRHSPAERLDSTLVGRAAVAVAHCQLPPARWSSGAGADRALRSGGPEQCSVVQREVEERKLVERDQGHAQNQAASGQKREGLAKPDCGRLRDRSFVAGVQDLWALSP